jgi:hypothetical protein
MSAESVASRMRSSLSRNACSARLRATALAKTSPSSRMRGISSGGQ